MRRWTAALGAGLVLAAWSQTARAEGLRVGVQASVLHFDQNGQTADLLYTQVSARVARGRAGLSFSVPMVALRGGVVATSGEAIAVRPGASEQNQFRFGLGDMSVGLDYNIVQNRERMFIVTLGGLVRFPTAPSDRFLGAGEHTLGLSLSAVYGLTPKLLAFAEVRQAWVGVLTPVQSRARAGELGAVYWFTEKLGLSASTSVTDYGPVSRLEPSWDFNLGLVVEVLPGLNMNLGGLAGLLGPAPQIGGSLGFGFEL